MTIQRAEELKKELTDQWVRVSSTAPELQRFADSVGRVRTVSMNCRALVEFIGDKDASWYDIAPEFLTLTEEPEIVTPVSATGKSKRPGSRGVPSGGTKTTTSKALSPLEAIRSGGVKQPEGDHEAPGHST